MSFIVNISSHADRRQDPYAGIHGNHARRMLQLYRRGAKLYVWRGTTPHNWWIETADGITHTVAGDRETNGILGVAHLNTPRILKTLGRKVFTSPDRVPPHALHRDGGKPFKEGWEFDSLRVASMEEQWAEVQKAVLIRKDNPPAFRPDLAVLSQDALALLRLLKASASVYPYEELLGPLAELDRQGFLLMNEQGEFHLHPDASAITVPRGERMKLRFSRVTQH